jgi:hypothetical protein
MVEATAAYSSVRVPHSSWISTRRLTAREGLRAPIVLEGEDLLEDLFSFEKAQEQAQVKAITQPSSPKAKNILRLML